METGCSGGSERKKSLNRTMQYGKIIWNMRLLLYVAYKQEIYSLLTLRFHKFEKTQSVKL